MNFQSDLGRTIFILFICLFCTSLNNSCVLAEEKLKKYKSRDKNQSTESSSVYGDKSEFQLSVIAKTEDSITKDFKM